MPRLQMESRWKLVGFKKPTHSVGLCFIHVGRRNKAVHRDNAWHSRKWQEQIHQKAHNIMNGKPTVANAVPHMLQVDIANKIYSQTKMDHQDTL